MNGNFVITRGSSPDGKYSVNGLTWLSTNTPVAANRLMGPCVQTSSGFFAFAGSYADQSFNYVTSIDGATWAEPRACRLAGAIPFVGVFSSAQFQGLFWNGVNFVACVGWDGQNIGQMLISPDFVTWTPVTGNIGVTPRSLTWDNQQFIVSCNAIAAGLVNPIYTSPNGINWTNIVSQPLVTGTANRMRAMRKYRDGYIATGAGGNTGATNTFATAQNISGPWTPYTFSPTVSQSYDSAFINGRYVITCFPAGNVITSTDFINWTLVNIGATANFAQNAMIVKNGLLIASTTNGECWSTPDGLVWTKSAALGTGYAWAT